MSALPSDTASDHLLNKPDDLSPTSEEHSPTVSLPPAPEPSERFMFLGKIIMPLSFLSAWGWYRYFTFIFAHIVFRWIARIYPRLDPSGHLVKTSFSTMSNIASLFIYAQVIGLYAVYIIPFAIRYRTCKEAKSFAPATELRRRWTPSFWTPAVRRPVSHVWAISLCVLSAYTVRALEGAKVPVLDPLRAAMVGAVGRAVFVVGRNSIYETYPNSRIADETGEYDVGYS
ncbi:hypothetical protein BD309DRAFT_971128 [Dichomitus squalens]|uniref:Uncharacterized protein n=1 Tax=Dichomitus squalens TaxID=114155 RepID=A0A4Q9NGP5_9APHY|nr:hypothetical protein BD311DRAFT_103799 [Dichomitus squalens]TBU38792.1 hypothetical protein BD309DRAFT_971128 [Dichomitus squalens]TBU64309.1 hypothetical protein BD310DRAFT_392321 [Dichomitus squalens]